MSDELTPSQQAVIELAERALEDPGNQASRTLVAIGAAIVEYAIPEALSSHRTPWTTGNSIRFVTCVVEIARNWSNRHSAHPMAELRQSAEFKAFAENLMVPNLRLIGAHSRDAEELVEYLMDAVIGLDPELLKSEEPHQRNEIAEAAASGITMMVLQDTALLLEEVRVKPGQLRVTYQDCQTDIDNIIQHVLAAPL